MKIRNTSKRSGDAAIGWRDNSPGEKNGTEGRESTDFSAFRARIMKRFLACALLSILIVVLLYLFLWREQMGDWTVRLLEIWMGIDHEDAFYLYNDYFRGYREIFFAAAVVLIFLLLLRYLFFWMNRYFREIDRGIESLLSDRETPLRLSPEMRPFEIKLNTVRRILSEREQEARSAERRKNELVMYLAHDIRTPLTSVIGYLSLLVQLPSLPEKEREKYVHISLEKAQRLEKMLDEFFEITRYNTGRISIHSAKTDLHYLLVQAVDEHLPLFTGHGNYVTFHAPQSLSVVCDAEKMARVFNNLLKNAAAYSEAGTEIIVRAEETKEDVTVSVSSHGKTIPKDRLEDLFEKFYRLDESRASKTGGTGLGLAIAREIVTLHGGTITAKSEDGLTTFTVRLPSSSS